MRRYYIGILFILAFLSGCVERYFIDENVDLTPKIVIEGTITDECKPQEIVISRSSSTNYPEFMPYSDCSVQVVDANGNLFEFVEDQTNRGHYICDIDEKYLLIGNKFKLTVITPENKHYESPFEEMLPCPEIDSLYYKVEHQPTAVEGKLIDGLQFYVDFKGSDYFGHYYRWVLDETYEYHSTWPIKTFIDENGRFHDDPIDFSKFVCYHSSTLNETLTLSTESLTQNSFEGAKLIFVDDHTQRLLYNYSLTVRQLSLSEKSYNYWEKLKKNNKSGGGLFTKQPAIIVGNLMNSSDSDESVLGYFGVSSVTTKQILVKKIEELSYSEIQQCTPFFFKYTLTPMDPRPLYTFYTTDPFDGTWSYAWSAIECFDCTVLGGVVDKPSFFE